MFSDLIINNEIEILTSAISSFSAFSFLATTIYTFAATTAPWGQIVIRRKCR